MAEPMDTNLLMLRVYTDAVNQTLVMLQHWQDNVEKVVKAMEEGRSVFQPPQG